MYQLYSLVFAQSKIYDHQIPEGDISTLFCLNASSPRPLPEQVGSILFWSKTEHHGRRPNTIIEPQKRSVGAAPAPEAGWELGAERGRPPELRRVGAAAARAAPRAPLTAAASRPAVSSSGCPCRGRVGRAERPPVGVDPSAPAGPAASGGCSALSLATQLRNKRNGKRVRSLCCSVHPTSAV